MGTDAGAKDVLHQPVLLGEVIEWLRPGEGGTFVDCTVGLGGHTKAILTASPETRVIGLDRDLDAVALATERLSMFEQRVRLLHANFADVACVLEEQGIATVRGMLADLGVSSLQLELAGRGFSFGSDEPLDMRMDQETDLTAADLVNELSETDLANTIFEYGEERGSRRIAREIIRQRRVAKIETTRQLTEIVVRALNVPGRWRIHPATRTFQALRIAVNDELAALERFIPSAICKLERGGRLAIISFHSLEDRIVKKGFLRESGRCICETRGLQPIVSKSDAAIDAVICDRCGATKRVKVLTRKPIRPGKEETAQNPRSRSSLLRVCERL